ncbi:MAG: glycosyltransferase [Phycisphaerae bacterium]
MRIAFFVTAFPEASITFVINQITFLLDRGHDVDIFATRRGKGGVVHADVARYRLPDRTCYLPAPPDNLWIRRMGGLGILARYGWRSPAAYLRAMDPRRFGKQVSSMALPFRMVPFLPGRSYDVIHCHFGPTGRIAADLCEVGVLKGNLITTFHGYGVTAYPRRHGSDVYRRLFDRGDLFTANSSFTLGKLTELGCPPARIVRLPVGLNLKDFAFAERRLRSDDPITILTVARLVEVKGVEYGIRAIAKLAPTYPRLRYQIVGDGPLRPALEQLAADLGVADRCRFLGAMTQEQLRQTYAQAHLFMLTGVVGRDGAEEGQGLVLLEAQATGLPVLASRVGGVPDSMLDGESGVLVEPGHVEALADRIGWLIEHAEAWPQMGRMGRAFVERGFDIQRLNDRLIELYERLLRKR